MNKKVIIILIAVVCVIILGVGGYFAFKSFGNVSETADLNAVFDPNKPIVIKKDGKYGYITADGKMMIEPKYEKANDFMGDYAVVRVKNTNEDSLYDEIYQIINKKGDVLLEVDNTIDSPKYYSKYNIWLADHVLYDSNFNKISGDNVRVRELKYNYFEYDDSEKDECGIINHKGEKIYSCTGDYHISVNFSENSNDTDDIYAGVIIYSGITAQKEEIISLKSKQVLFTLEDLDNNTLYARKNGMFYVYNKPQKTTKYLFFANNKLAYQTNEVVKEVEVYDYKNQILEIDYGYDYDELGKKQRRYYYDVKNNKMLEEKPSSTEDIELNLIEMTYGFKEYSSSGKYGLMLGEKIILPCEYDDIEYLERTLYDYLKSKGKEIVLLEKGKQTIVYNLKSFKELQTFESKDVTDYTTSTFIKVVIKNEETSEKSCVVYNLLTGKSMSFEKSDKVSIESNHVTYKTDEAKTYYNTDLKEIYVENLK